MSHPLDSSRWSSQRARWRVERATRVGVLFWASRTGCDGLAARRAGSALLLVLGIGCGNSVTVTGGAGGAGEAASTGAGGAVATGGRAAGGQPVGGGAQAGGGSNGGSGVACWSALILDDPIDEVCTSCTQATAASTCADELEACDESCVQFSDCTSFCGGDENCCSECAALHPNGAKLFSALVDCSFCQECTEECPGFFPGFSTCL